MLPTTLNLGALGHLRRASASHPSPSGRATIPSWKMRTQGSWGMLAGQSPTPNLQPCYEKLAEQTERRAACSIISCPTPRSHRAQGLAC